MSEKNNRKQTELSVRVCVCEHHSLCEAHVNTSVFDRPGAKMNDVWENCAYSSDKSLFCKLP